MEIKVEDLLKQFPGYHVEIQLYPSGGLIEATGCEECGLPDDQFESVIFGPKRRSKTLNDAIEDLKCRLADRYGDSAFYNGDNK